MRLPIILSISLFIGCSQSPVPKKDIIAYYPSWRFADRDTLVSQASLPYDKVTIINYAFFYPTPEGDLIGLNPEADAYVLNDLIDPSTGIAIPNTSLVGMAEKHGVKVMLSLGGWEDSDNFPAISADQEKRERFAASCVNLIKRYGFHGIDIDWEYPGYEPHNGSPADSENFTLLLKVLREALDSLEEESGNYYAMSHAISASPFVAKGTDYAAISPLLDFFNIMTYDFHGVWDTVSNHNSPLYAPAVGASTANLSSAFTLYHDHYGIPAHKLNLGVAFYGRTFNNCSEIHKPHAGASTYFHPEGFADYYMIVENSEGFVRKWDDQAKVPYLINESEKILVSYDDPESVGLKADFVKDVNARGVIIWQVMGDHLKTGETPLLDVLNDKLGK
jgi:chitinase